MKTFKSKLQEDKYGLYFIIPKEIVKENNWKTGDELELSIGRYPA